jgi:hypothetical protein
MNQLRAAMIRTTHIKPECNFDPFDAGGPGLLCAAFHIGEIPEITFDAHRTLRKGRRPQA